MPLNEDYDGETLVAFIDISGFKKLLREKDGNLKAEESLRKFFKIVFDKLYDSNRVDHPKYSLPVEGLFVSDCGVVFLRKGEEDNRRRMNVLLEIIRDISKEMLRYNYLLPTSIAYGQFSYKALNEFTGIVKNMIWGNAYLNAFLDSEIKEKNEKILPGQCRIVSKNLPHNVESQFGHGEDIFKMINRRGSDEKRYYYYWSLDNSNYIDEFESKYCEIMKMNNEEKYDRIKSLLKIKQPPFENLENY